jgi:hypothetical protein
MLLDMSIIDLPSGPSTALTLVSAEANSDARNYYWQLPKSSRPRAAAPDLPSGPGDPRAIGRSEHTQASATLAWWEVGLNA